MFVVVSGDFQHIERMPWVVRLGFDQKRGVRERKQGSFFVLCGVSICPSRSSPPPTPPSHKVFVVKGFIGAGHMPPRALSWRPKLIGRQDTRYARFF